MDSACGISWYLRLQLCTEAVCVSAVKCMFLEEHMQSV